MLFDTHTHLQFKAFSPERSLRISLDQVITDAKKSGVQYINVVGTDLDSSKKAIEIAEKYEGTFATVGIHPHHIFSYLTNNVIPAKAGIKILDQAENDLKKIEQLLKNKKVIAVGETGMDRHVYKKTRYSRYKISDKLIDLQRQAFETQIKLAIKHHKSLVIHNREAIDDLLQILALHLEGAGSNLKSVFHCCEPDQRLLDFAIKHKIYIGIDGDITYYPEKQEFIKKIPLDLLVLETDSPFLTPKGFKSPNNPSNLNYILEFIAKILEVDKKELPEITFKNSKKLFNL